MTKWNLKPLGNRNHVTPIIFTIFQKWHPSAFGFFKIDILSTRPGASTIHCTKGPFVQCIVFKYWTLWKCLDCSIKWLRGYLEDMQGPPGAISRDSENDKRFRGYLEEMQGSLGAISRDSENDYILEDSEDILRRCKDLLKRFPEILKTVIYWKIPRISWGGARISWSGFQRFWERWYIGRLHGYPEEVQGSPGGFPEILRTTI